MTKDSRRLPLADWQLQDSARLKAIFMQKRAGLKLTQEKIAGELGEGVTQGAVSHFMNGRTALSLRAATVFAKALQVPVAQFSPTLSTQLEGMASSLSVETDPPARPIPSNVVQIKDVEPIATDWGEFAFVDQYSASAAAGKGYDNTHVVLRNTLAFKRDWLKVKGVNPKNLKVIYAEGESMSPTISDHDVLLVDGSHVDPHDGQIFVIESQDRGTIVKRLVKSDFDGWIIRSDNPDKISYGDEVLPDGEIFEHRILGRVIWRGGDL
jgi:phage repressor protein C with HTH and peptisase S24 domain